MFTNYTDGKVRSKVLHTFWKDEYATVIYDILDKIINHPSQYPGTSNEGIAICIDEPFGQNPSLNTQRKAVLRQYYSLGTDRDGQSYTYGVGTGSSTVGGKNG